MIRLSAYISSCWNLRFQHAGLSARLYKPVTHAMQYNSVHKPVIPAIQYNSVHEPVTPAVIIYINL